MRRVVLLTVAAVLLVEPTVLAFFSGGNFDGPRLVATALTWALVLLLAFLSEQPLPGSWPGRVALAGLALIAAWTGASIAWAPQSGPATDSFVRLLLYLGAFLAAMAVLRDRLAARAAEPLLALGALVVTGYGLSGRLLPGVIQLAQSNTAGGRLEQPITYWNAEGLLAAVGLILCARLAGDETRPRSMRVAAATVSAPLGLGVYLTLSRGAIAAAVVGMLVLIAAAPTRRQLRAIALALGAGMLAAAASALLPGVASLAGSAGERNTDGLVMLALLAALMATAGVVQWLAARAERDGDPTGGRLALARRLPALALVALGLALAGLVAGGFAERGSDSELSERRGAARLTSFESRRYDYWRVGAGAFTADPLQGSGAAGFRAVWRRERPVRSTTLQVHSLPLEMAAELGLVGLLGLALLVAGTGVAALRALRRGGALAPAACAAGTAWLLHASIDWDWQLPAVTLPVLILAAGLVAEAEADGEEAAAISPAPAGRAA